MREASDAVARLEAAGDFGADLDDCAAVVAANGGADALLSEGREVDVLPVLIVSYGYPRKADEGCYQSVGFRATAFTLTKA